MTRLSARRAGPRDPLFHNPANAVHFGAPLTSLESSLLSRLLRRLLLAQFLAGAGLGWLLTEPTGMGDWLPLATALALPPTTSLLAIITSGLLSRAPGAQALWLRALLFEYGASIRVFLLQQPWVISPPRLQAAAVSPSPARIPVLLVHGFLCNHKVWDRMAQRLRLAGHPVWAIDLEPVFGSIEGYAPLIEDAVRTLCHQTGATQVALVGHSMGGLAIRAWMRAHGSERVALVITLGTPHAGTRSAWLAPCENARQMRWHSAWLRELAMSEPASARRLMRIALSPQDNIVHPQREQVLAGAPVTLFHGLGHLSLCHDEDVMAWVVRQLQEAGAR